VGVAQEGMEVQEEAAHNKPFPLPIKKKGKKVQKI